MTTKPYDKHKTRAARACRKSTIARGIWWRLGIKWLDLQLRIARNRVIKRDKKE